jgi:hypothetical protein
MDLAGCVIIKLNKGQVITIRIGKDDKFNSYVKYWRIKVYFLGKIIPKRGVLNHHNSEKDKYCMLKSVQNEFYLKKYFTHIGSFQIFHSIVMVIGLNLMKMVILNEYYHFLQHIYVSCPIVTNISITYFLSLQEKQTTLTKERNFHYPLTQILRKFRSAQSQLIRFELQNLTFFDEMSFTFVRIEKNLLNYTGQK